MKNSTKTPQRLFGSSESRPATPTAEVEFTDRDYAEVLAELLDAIGTKNYFSSTIITDHEGFHSRLTITLIVHRKWSDQGSIVCDFLPVWWDMKCYLDDPAGEPDAELPNDFSFHTLRQMFLQQ